MSDGGAAPGGRGDVRDEMVQIIARDAKAANVELEVQVYPGASLFKPNDQWNAMVNGQLDISLFPLDYASGKEFHPLIRDGKDYASACTFVSVLFASLLSLCILAERLF